MIDIKVEYRVKADKVDQILDVIQEFLSGIKENEPNTSYVAYQLSEDEQEFVHFMRFADSKARDYHQSAPHTKQFVQQLYPECEREPKFTDLNLISDTSP